MSTAPHTGHELVDPSPVREAYEHKVSTDDLVADPIQRDAADRLDRLVNDLAEARPATKSSALGWLFGKRREKRSVRGLYLYGGVGRGKTMLMDLFFAHAPLKRKRRSHFNDFMADVHDRIGAHRQALKNGEAKSDDPIPPVAEQIAEESWLICFDEFTVTDIADAMVLSRLFSALFDNGCVLVATSNVAPDDLYKDGLNRSLFTPFIDVLKAHTDIMELDNGHDYRLDKLSALPVYMTPLSEETARQMDRAWQTATDGKSEDAETVEVKGRTIEVPRTAGRMARFTFDELCNRPLGARDYMALTDRFDHFFIEGVPQMDLDRRNEAKRFILLIDTLYDRKKCLHLSAAAPASDLYVGKSGTESFEFDRTVSRLIEMRDENWPPKNAAGRVAAGE
ncbi:cell division protein ZapE [Notoacmeibacter sp. MSK16QG-6]|uniref:cell division protein ZapE n=1 Tax=Notoacmeibacter sp. MSK16QG-6 TaxID=2957982 RepID=UPI00209F656C|nr:cell division protein ZapE [Notoacmeibacter sp. MSK16QG-6]MCP1199182.1 cell division protein ZapE [Notoacmeibacter sp. MSK16QG-6]